MLEYASIRFTFGWTSATILPPVIVTAASTANTALQSSPNGPSEPIMIRRMAANAAAFGATLMNAVAGVGAPSYASGVHWWNGTTAALNARPTVTSARATSVAPSLSPRFATASATPANAVVPLIP